MATWRPRRLAGTQCQLVTLKPGDHADLTWTDGITYRVTLVKFNLITRKSLPGAEGDGNGNSGARNAESRSGRNASAWHSPTGDHFSF